MAGMYCAVALCRNYYGKVGKDGIDDRISFHRLPANPTMRKKWVTLCKRSDKFNPSTSFICSEHFKPEDFVRDFQAELLGYTPKKRLHPDTIPTRNIPNDPNSTQTDSAVRRRKRMAEKKERMDHLDALNAGLQAERPSTSQQLDNYEEIDEPSLSFQEVVTSDYKLLYEEMKSKNSSLQEKVRAQTLKLKRANIHVKRLNRKTQTQKTKFTNKIKQLTILLKHHRAAKKEQNLTLKTAVKQLLEKKFTANEIELLTEKKNKVHWTSAEISKAFTLRYLGKRAYIYVRKTLQFPLPGLSSLQKWAKRINLRNGLLTDVLMVMKTAGNSMDNFSKLTVIMFDEMKIESTLEYDTLEDRIFGRHNQMQIIMARGLCSKWKQPIYVAFDQKVTKDILFKIIAELKEIGYPVVACVSDLGPGNLGLIKELGINFENPCFALPGTHQSIAYFPDAPHLLKLIRNWFIDTGFNIGDIKVNSEPIKHLLMLTSGEPSVCHKLTKCHLTCEKSQRQNVAMAAQLLSHSTATALVHYKPGDDKILATDTGKFIELVNSWFDLMNSRIPGQHKTPFTAPYGDSILQQNLLLDEFYSTIFKMRCIGKNQLLLFQKGILMSINSLKSLYSTLSSLFNVKYILTAKLNQDALENLFSQIRSRGGLNDHPSPLNALYRLRMIFLGKNVGVVSQRTNCPIEENEEFILATAFKKAGIDVGVDEETPSQEKGSETDTASEAVSLSSSEGKGSFQYEYAQGDANTDALRYLAGWLAKKFIGEFNFGSPTCKTEKQEHDYAMPTWIHHLSYGGLIDPNENFFTKIKKLEKIFNKIYTEDFFFNEKKIVEKLTIKSIDKLGDNYLPMKVIKAFMKERIFIKMKYLNHSWEQELSKKRKGKAQLKSAKKMRKVCT